MSYCIPVMYAICEPEEVPHDAQQWSDANAVLEKALDDPATYHLHMATATNWWQIQAITDVRDREGLEGLEFCDREIALLSGANVKTAIESMAVVLRAYQDQEGATPPEMYTEQVPVDIDCDDDPDGAFFYFLTSLITVLEEAMRTGKSFLYIQPQP